jgi:hypothetical protein
MGIGRLLAGVKMRDAEQSCKSLAQRADWSNGVANLAID